MAERAAGLFVAVVLAAGFFVAVVLAAGFFVAVVFLDALFAAALLADVGGCFAVVFLAVALRFAGRGVVMVQPPAVHLQRVAG